MAKGATWRVVDHWAKDAKRESASTHPKLWVGVTPRTSENPHPKSDTPVGDIAFYNEFGTMDIPARSFIRDWVDGDFDNIAAKFGKDILRTLTSNESMRTALDKRGKEYRKAIIKRIQARIPPPNTAGTLLQKSGNVPLIDTETLIAAIIHEVK